MRDYLIAVNPTLWDVVEVGITFSREDATLTQDQGIDIQCNYQALHLIKSSLCAEEFDKIDGLQSTKEVWDTLFISHQGTRRVREGRIRALESELNRFIIRENETSQEMYNRLNKIINKIKSLGSDKWGRREVVDKILSFYMSRDVQLSILIREKRGFKKFTLKDMIGRIEEHLITIKESKLSQEMFKIHEQLEKNNGVALKASNKNKEKGASTSSKATIKEDSDDSDSESMDEEEIALFMRRINKVMKRGGFFDKNKDKNKTKRKSKRPCFGCGKEGHFIANCPEVKMKKNNSSKFDKSKYKKNVDLTDDEDDFTHTCFMAREPKDRDETLKVQEELFRFEREKTIALENSLENEKKGFKMQEDLLKTKNDTTLSLEKSLAKEKIKWKN
ncbi:uncharacterized protein LOC105914187 [Setaria italica]|uniref:uncharacterized protein LOC105914187 n=1 Tax=Setaria italica TaxID=4555 RepID=UPI00064739B6|nr:uncharacterized protein LOC105914187 [Setaria italica]